MSKNKLVISSFLILLFSICNFSCRNDITGPANGGLSLTLSDVSCTEAWLKLSTGIISLPANITIKKNDKDFLNIILSQSDTTIYDNTLLPNKTYTYQAIYSGSKTEEVTAKTLDTTGGNFIFKTYTFGGNAGSSAFYDCAIVNDTLAYAVGEVYLNDSTGQPDPQAYGVAKWNGKTWSLKKVYHKDKDYQGNDFTMALSGIRGILAINSADIWLAAGSVFHWDGSDSFAVFSYDILTPAGLQPGINKLWGISSNDLYGVGNSGSIICYSNGNWQKIESGTNLQFTDIYGITDPETGKQQILAVCTQNTPPANGLFSISGNTATMISTNFSFPGYTIPPELYGVWFVPNGRYYIVGDGIYEKHSLSENIWKNGPQDITKYATTRIRGNGLNDIYAVGAFGEFLHFNGVRWKSFRDETALENGSYTSVAVKGNLIIAVGANNPQAVITMGQRN